MTIVPIGKIILQEPKGEGSTARQAFDQRLQEIVRAVVGECIEGMLCSELDRQLVRKRHQRRAKMWGELYTAR